MVAYEGPRLFQRGREQLDSTQSERRYGKGVCW